MAVLSRKTTGLGLRLLDQHFTRSGIEALLYECDVPDDLVYGSSKLALLLNVFRGLEQRDRKELLLAIVTAVLKSIPDYARLELESSLRRDGYVFTGEILVPEEPIGSENKSALVLLIENHSASLEVEVLRHHLIESEEEFRLEKWDSSIGQARKFIEKLLADVANAISRLRSETVELEKPVKVREYLQAVGFFDEGERRKLVDGVYGYLSEEGAHPGISNQSVARVCLSILWSFGFYVLEKFDAWLSNNQ